MLWETFVYDVWFFSIHNFASIHGRAQCNKQNMFAEYIFLPFFFTLNKKCYKMLLNEIIVSTTVKSKEIKTVQINHKDLRKKLLGTPCFYFLSLCCLINELEIRQYESIQTTKILELSSFISWPNYFNFITEGNNIKRKKIVISFEILKKCFWLVWLFLFSLKSNPN